MLTTSAVGGMKRHQSHSCAWQAQMAELGRTPLYPAADTVRINATTFTDVTHAVFWGAGLVGVDMCAHNRCDKSGIACQDRNQRPEANSNAKETHPMMDRRLTLGRW
jgi:hypothetical protein